jgi:hypothetical protein
MHVADHACGRAAPGVDAADKKSDTAGQGAEGAPHGGGHIAALGAGLGQGGAAAAVLVGRLLPQRPEAPCRRQLPLHPPPVQHILQAAGAGARWYSRAGH